MIVRFTDRQWKFVYGSAVDAQLYDIGEPVFTEWLDDVEEHTPHRIDATMPYIGWLCLVHHCFDLVYSVGGNIRGGTPLSHVRAMQVAAAALALHQSSPAFRGAAAVGSQAVLYPAWIRHDGIRSPMPVDGADFRVLVPEVSIDQRGTWTSWYESSTIGFRHRLFNEESHRAFLRTGLDSGPLAPDHPVSRG